MIIAQNIYKKIGNKTILNNINLHIKKGDFVVILGPNGAGKTTLIKILSLLTLPTSGELMISQTSAKRVNLEIKRKIGVISHQTFLYNNLTAYENLDFYGRLYGVNDLRNRIIEVLKEVGLEFTLNDPVKTFSRGMQQRLAIARAIIHNPDVLFLDEPYSGLDQHAIDILNKVLLKGLKDKTVFMSTHNFEQGLNNSDRVVILNKGRIVNESKTDDMSLEDLKRIYMFHVGGGSQ
ncbi:MAG: ABC transporter ATP-binding protein [Bacillota bacterium]